MSDRDVGKLTRESITGLKRSHRSALYDFHNMYCAISINAKVINSNQSTFLLFGFLKNIVHFFLVGLQVLWSPSVGLPAWK